MGRLLVHMSINFKVSVACNIHIYPLSSFKESVQVWVYIPVFDPNELKILAVYIPTLTTHAD